MIGVGLVVAIVCAPNFVIDLQKLYGVSLLHPFGIICIFNSSVPIWGAFGVALPLLNYLVPAFVSTLLTALLSVRLLRHTRQHQSRLASQEVMRVGSSFENSGGSSGGRSTASKQLPVLASYFKTVCMYSYCTDIVLCNTVHLIDNSTRIRVQ